MRSITKKNLQFLINNLVDVIITQAPHQIQVKFDFNEAIENKSAVLVLTRMYLFNTPVKAAFYEAKKSKSTSFINTFKTLSSLNLKYMMKSIHNKYKKTEKITGDFISVLKFVNEYLKT